MDAAEWIERCAWRLRRRWPALAQQDLDEAATDLHRDARWRGLAPEAAASAWLRLGLPDEAAERGSACRVTF